MNARTEGQRAHLQLVEGQEPQPGFEPALHCSIWSAPFRPGELPLTFWLPLERQLRELISSRAADVGLPVELCVRIAVESSRLLCEISSLSGSPRDVVASALSLAAGSSPSSARREIGIGTLRRYAVELERPRACSAVGAELALRLPEEMNGAWSRAAGEARLSMSEWVARRLEQAPAECVRWEAASAAASQSLAEWSYASWLRASARSSA